MNLLNFLRNKSYYINFKQLELYAFKNDKIKMQQKKDEYFL